jgi:nitroreductase
MDEEMNSAALDVLLSRYSLGVKHLAEPGPSDDELRILAHAALRAPDHGELVPWRLAVVRGEARVQLADLFAEHAQRKGKDAEGVAIERERALRAPVTVAVLARIDLGHPQVPAHEQWMGVGGAVANLLNALHAMGYAGKMLSGDKARAPHIAQAFCESGETLVGWVAMGTPTRSLSTNGHKTSDVLRFWGA